MPDGAISGPWFRRGDRVYHLDGGSSLYRDETHRPAGKAPLCPMCEEPVGWIEEQDTRTGETVDSWWDLCDRCALCPDCCYCPGEEAPWPT